jgi:hypothetical protein
MGVSANITTSRKLFTFIAALLFGKTRHDEYRLEALRRISSAKVDKSSEIIGGPGRKDRY